MNEKLPTEVTVQIPIALEQLIKTSNDLLKNYQAKLMDNIQRANVNLMELMQLRPEEGWRLDMDRMVYTRPITEDDIVQM